MAKEIQVAHTRTGKTLYFMVWNAVGSVWNGSSFVTYATVSRGSYDIAMTEQGTASRFYAGDFPGLAQAVYFITAYEQAGGSPAETDELVAMGEFHWNGTANVPRGTLINDAITASKIAADAIGSSELAASAVTEIQSGLATAAALVLCHSLIVG